MMRLSTRILLGYFLVIGLMGALVMKFVVDQIKPSVRETIEEVMIDSAHLLAEQAATDFVASQFASSSFAKAISQYSTREINARVWHFEKTHLDFEIYVTDNQGTVIFDSTGKSLGKNFSAWRNVNLTLSGKYGARSTRYSLEDDTSSVFHVSAPIYSHDALSSLVAKDIVGTVTLAKSIASIEPVIARARQSILQKAAALIAVAAAVGALITWRLNRSIARLVNYATAVSTGQPVSAPTTRAFELDQLAKAMEAMRTELAGKRQAEQYAQGLAHELKSPLSALAASAELLAEPCLTESDRERLAHLHARQIVKMNQAIDSMLAAARLENHQPQWSKVDISAMVAQLVDENKIRATAQSVTLTLISPEQPIVIKRADSNVLGLAISNLLTNALQFSPSGSKIQVVVSANDESVQVSIEDQGPGIADYAMNRVFERFYSLARPNGDKGSGLGLSIVHYAAQLHGGEITLHNLNPGLRARLVVPS
jgi:two-component system, OmpR family, sensor histidine kinase CreC